MTIVAKSPVISPSGIHLRKNARVKYDAILKSAHRLFLKHGYTHTSMDAIAEAADVSKQTVYSYFTNKDVLFCQMVEAECLRHSPSENMLDNPQLKPEEALMRIGQGYMETIIGHRGVAILRLVMIEAERHPRIAKLFFECGPLKSQKLLAEYLNKHNDVFDIDQHDVAAAHFLSLIKGRYRMRVALKIKPLPTKKEINDHIRETVRLFFKMYGR